LRKDGGFDLAVDLQGTQASAAWVYASGAERMADRGQSDLCWIFCDFTKPGVFSSLANSFESAISLRKKQSDLPKGPSLAADLYDDPALRECNDIDLIVEEQQIARAEGVLGSLGFGVIFWTARGERDVVDQSWWAAAWLRGCLEPEWTPIFCG
jgi:hypothetical protein